jgi:hypothetical protein
MDKKYYVIVFDSRPKTKANIVPREWIVPKPDKKEFGSRRYVYYHDDLNQHPPTTTMLHSLCKPTLKQLEPGFLYVGTVLKGFGKIYRTVNLSDLFQILFCTF